MVFFHLDKKLYYASDTVRAKGGSDIISFDQFVMEDGVPIYIQILQYIKRSIVAGTIQNGDELPSHRFCQLYWVSILIRYYDWRVGDEYSLSWSESK